MAAFRDMKESDNNNEPLLDWICPTDESSEDVNINDEYKRNAVWLVRLKYLSGQSSVKQKVTEQLVDKGELDERGLNEQAPDDAAIVDYARYLINCQHRDMNIRSMLHSFSLSKQVCDSDAYSEFVVHTSCLAVSTLLLILQDYPSLAKQIDGLKQCIRRGLGFISRNNFSGNGYESTQMQVENVFCLAYGKVFEFAREDPKFNPRFLKAMEKARQQIENNLQAESGWSKVPEDSCRQALSLLGEGVNDECPSHCL